METARPTDDLRYGVLGAGLIGTYLGGLLAEAGRDVTFVGRARTRGAIAANGLRLTHYDKAELRPTTFVYETDVAALANCDVVLVCVKSGNTADVAQSLAEILRDAPLVVSFQNGVRNAAKLAEHLPVADVLPGLVPFNVTSPEPGRFHQGTEGGVFIKAASDHRLIALKAAFESAGLDVDLRQDMQPLLWGKLLLNLNNPLNALWGRPLRAGLMQGSYRRVLARVLDEALAALDAAGIAPEPTSGVPPSRLPGLLRLPTPIYALLMRLLIRIDPTARSSMLEDLERGRASENAFIQDEIIQLGRRHGVNVETNRRVAEAVERAFAQGVSPRMSGRDMVRAFLR